MTRITLPIVVVRPYRDWLIGELLRSSQPHVILHGPSGSFEITKASLAAPGSEMVRLWVDTYTNLSNPNLFRATTIAEHIQVVCGISLGRI